MIDTSNTSNTEIKSTNIISFPKKKEINNLSNATTQEEFIKQLDENKEKHIDDVLVRTMNPLYNHMAVEGFNIDDDVFFSDFSFAVESLKSAMMRQCGMEHPIQQIVDENFVATPSENSISDETENE